MKKVVRHFDYRHIICILLTLISIACSIFVFPNAFGRLIESFRDFGLSVAYYFESLFGESSIVPTVNDLPKIPYFDNINLPSFEVPSFPEDWEKFKVAFVDYWELFGTTENFQGYIVDSAIFIGNFAKIAICVLPVMMIGFILFARALNQENNDYGLDTKPLQIYKKAVLHTYIPVRDWVKSFVAFVKENRIYPILWMTIWAYNFNLFTILIEFLAFYFYFALSFDFASIYTQIYKFAIDLYGPVKFIPWPVWMVIGFVVFDKMRKKIGYSRLHHNEMKNRGFINELPIVDMVCATMGKKKTTTITDMALSQEVMFRDKAYELILQNDLKFPNFPWINFELTLKKAMELHLVYNLASCRKFVGRCKALFEKMCIYDIPTRKSYIRHLKKTKGKFKFEHNYNCLFGYDYERYGMTYNDELKIVDIWDVLTSYAQLYFIYVIQSSLLISNYSVRVDNILSDAGNFPLWNTDFFKRDSRYADAISRHAHILDYDSFRLGKKVLENNQNANNFEFGVVLITEVGKERGNAIELSEKKKNEKVANQKNDLFNSWLKMVRHSATVDNFPFVRVLTDEQRPESWGADARDLCDVIFIKECSDVKLTIPCFAVGDMVISWLLGKFEGIYQDYRYKRGDNTLSMHLLKNIVAWLNKYYTGIYNRFGYSKLKIQISSGTMDGAIKEKDYYLSSIKTYSKRFATDCYSDTFSVMALRSSKGINDLVEYETERASFAELELQNSYFVAELILGLKNKKE